MIGYFRDAAELLQWAERRSDESFGDFAESGRLLTLGYALAMADVAQAVVGEDVEAPAYQLPLAEPAAPVPFPSREQLAA